MWGHVFNESADADPERLDGETERGQGVATLEATDVPDHTGVEMRVTLPRTPGTNVSGARVEDGEGLPQILAEEEQLDEDFSAPWPSFKRWVADNAVLLSLAVAAFDRRAARAAELARARAPDRCPEYIPEPPDDADPALAYGLAHEGGDSTDTVLATLLDLVDRGYYKASSASTGDEKLDLALAVSDEATRTDGAGRTRSRS